MITDDPRTLVVGAIGEVWGRITDLLGTDLTGVTVQLRTVAPDGTLSSWAAPADTDTTQAAAGIVRAALEHTAAVAGTWELQAKVGTEIVKCGPFLVVEP
jgi:hypothetical protein